jgi:hypothetical protein
MQLTKQSKNVSMNLLFDLQLTCETLFYEKKEYAHS